MIKVRNFSILVKPTHEGKEQNVVEIDLRLTDAVDTKLSQYLT